MKIFLLEKSYINTYLDALSNVSAESVVAYKASFDQVSYDLVDGEAQINISGPLQRSPDFFSDYFGSSTYDEIESLTRMAASDPSVKRIAYIVNSPGGEVDGVDNLAQLISSVKKPTVAYIDNIAASAAYWLASQADKIIATSQTAEFGSIGVIIAGMDMTGMLEKEGAKRILITSTDAPDKKLSHQLDTDEGHKAMVARLDSIHEIFAASVASGRKTTVENVNENFGRGGVVSAKDSLTKKMIDSIINKNKLQADKKNVVAISAERLVKMNKEEMQEKHSDLLSSIQKESYVKGLDEGVSREKKRVEDLNAWRSKSESCDSIVDAAIKDGSSYSDVMSKLHASLPSKVEVEVDPPALCGDPETSIDGKKEFSEDQAKDLGKSLAQNILGGI